MYTLTRDRVMGDLVFSYRFEVNLGGGGLGSGWDWVRDLKFLANNSLEYLT